MLLNTCQFKHNFQYPYLKILVGLTVNGFLMDILWIHANFQVRNQA